MNFDGFSTSVDANVAPAYRDPRDRAARRASVQIHKTARVRAWKRAFKGILSPADVIAMGGR